MPTSHELVTELINATYDPVGFCIYCKTVGSHGNPVSDEHIVPEAAVSFGGNRFRDRRRRLALPCDVTNIISHRGDASHRRLSRARVLEGGPPLCGCADPRRLGEQVYTIASRARSRVRGGAYGAREIGGADWVQTGSGVSEQT